MTNPTPPRSEITRRVPPAGSVLNAYVRVIDLTIDDAGRELDRASWDLLLKHIQRCVEYVGRKGRAA